MPGQFNPLELLAVPDTIRKARQSRSMNVLGAPPNAAPHPNDMADLYGLQGEFGDEAEMRSIMAEKAGSPSNEISALNRLAGSWRQKQVGTMAGMMPTPREQDRISALDEGFGGSELHHDPVIARNLFKRNMEQERMRQPLEQTRMQQAGETQRQNISSNAERYKADVSYNESVDTEELRQEPNNAYAEIQRALMLDKDGNPRQNGNVAAVNKSGVRYQTQPNQTAANNQLAIIRGNLVKQGGVPFLNRNNPTREQAEYNSYITSTIAAANLPPEAKQDIAALLERPESAEMSIQQLIESLPIDHTQLDQNDIAALTDIFMKLKG